MIGPRTQGRNRLDPRTEAPRRHARGHLRTGLLTTGRTDQAVQLILGHDGLHRRDLGHLMPLGLGILPLQQVLTGVTSLRLDGDDDVHLLHRHQCPCLPCMARLAALDDAPWARAAAVGPGLGVGRSTVGATRCARSAAPAPATVGPSLPVLPRDSPARGCTPGPRGGGAPIFLVVRRSGCPWATIICGIGVAWQGGRSVTT